MKEWQKLGKHSGKHSIGTEKAHAGDKWAAAAEANQHRKLIARHRRAKGWPKTDNESTAMYSEHNGYLLQW